MSSKQNSWNAFLKQHAGTGLTKQQLSQKYKNRDKKKSQSPPKARSGKEEISPEHSTQYRSFYRDVAAEIAKHLSNKDLVNWALTEKQTLKAVVPQLKERESIHKAKFLRIPKIDQYQFGRGRFIYFRFKIGDVVYRNNYKYLERNNVPILRLLAQKVNIPNSSELTKVQLLAALKPRIIFE